MDRESYRIDVLHFMNPYLIWVERINEENESKESCFEQIGLYGVIPAELEPDFVQDIFKTKKSCQWSFAVTKKIEEILSTAVELRFTPIFTDCFRSSIFDSKCHKFGEILLMRDKKLERMSAILKQESVVCIDNIVFHTYLENGLVKTQLSIQERELVTHALVNAVKTSYKTKKLKQNTKVARNITLMGKQLEKMATNTKLTVTSQDHVHDVLAKKAMDYEYRDSDEMQYFGSGGGIRSTSSSLKSPIEPVDNTTNLSSDDEHVKVAKWLDKVPIAGETVSEELPTEIRSVTKNFVSKNVSNATTPINRRPPYSEEKKTPKKASKNNVPAYDSKKEHLVSIMPAGFSIGSAKLEVRSKFKITPAKPIERFEHTAGEVPDNIWRSIDSEVNMPIHKDNISHLISKQSNISYDFNSTKDNRSPTLSVPIKSNADNSATCSKSPNLLKDRRLSMLFDLSVSKANVKHVPDASDKGRGSVQTSNESNVKSPKVERSIDDLPYFKTVNTNKAEKASIVSSNNIKSPLPNKTSPASDASSSHVEILKKLMNRGIKNKTVDNFDETTSSVEPLDTTKSSIGISSSKSSDNDAADFNAHKSPFKSFRDHKNDLVVDDMSKFVPNIVTPVVMAHTKSGKRITPSIDLSDVYFPRYIKEVLHKLKINYSKDIQSFMWPAIMRGCSVFAVGPMFSGKTMGYIPPLSSLIAGKDIFEDLPKSLGGPLAVVVCSTVKSVEHVAEKFKSCLGVDGVVLACHSGFDMKKMCEWVLHGCDVLVATPGCLKNLLNVEYYSVDLRRLCYAVFDDFERLTDHFKDEFAFLYKKIRAMATRRLDTAFQVKFIVCSKVWNDFMSSWAKKLTNSVVCISAYEECVVYSKSLLNVRTVKEENKTKEMRDFLKDCDTKAGRTVIVCKTDTEINALRDILKRDGYDIFVGGTDLNVQEASDLSEAWNSLNNSINGNILICCDANLPVINTTNATYLINYSLPDKYSDFCKRFATLIDSYSSIFTEAKQKVRINVLIDENNSNQLPKLVNYLKRCHGKTPESLDVVVERVLNEKDLAKAKSCVPLCDSLLSYGECNDFWHCVQRHSTFEKYDTPAAWVPKDGWIKIKVMHYHSVADYSARVLAHITEESEKEFKQDYTKLTFKMSTYYSDENNRRLHGVAEPGDICAVQLKPAYYERCKFIKILEKGDIGKPNKVLILLIDDEKYETVLDCYLYYLPDALKLIPSYVARVKIAGLQPNDKDLYFTNDSKSDLMKLLKSYHGLYLKGRVVLSISNVIVIDRLEAYEDLKSGTTIIREDIRKYLLKTHAMENVEHLSKLSAKLGIKLIDTEIESPKPKKIKKYILPEPQWAHFEADDFSLVYFSSVISPEKFYVRLTKYQKCLNDLTVEIQKYKETLKDEHVDEKLLKIGSIVLAEFPDDHEYNRARIDGIEDDAKFKVFFVDHGDWRTVSKNGIKPLNAELINRLPFQAIECRLHGLAKTGSNWSDICTNYFGDLCYHANTVFLKEIYAKYFTKYPSESTSGFKYSVVLIDTSEQFDVVINEKMIEKNLAVRIEEELNDLKNLSFLRPKVEEDSDTELCLDEKESNPPKNKIMDLPDFENGEWDVSDDLLHEYADFVKEKNELTFKVIDRMMENISSDESGSAQHPKIVELTSDNEMEITKTLDLYISRDMRTTSQMSNNSSKLSKTFEIVEDPKDKIVELDSDDLSTPEVSSCESSKKRTPNIKWRQTKTNVTVKIEGADIQINKLDIETNRLTFEGIINDDIYAFDIKLYHVIDINKSKPTLKGLYVLVFMEKMMKVTWKALTADRVKRRWIVYDIDSLTVDSSDDEADIAKDNKAFKEYTLKAYEDQSDSDSGDSRMVDDLGKWNNKEDF